MTCNNFGGRGLLLAGFREFGAALIELPPEFGVFVFECCHPVVQHRGHVPVAPCFDVRNLTAKPPLMHHH